MDFLDLREPVSAWSHFAGLILAVPGTFLLWRRSGRNLAKRLSVLVYGLTLVFCYSASTLYHGVRLSPARIAEFARLDSIGIFFLIAGSYTPIAVCLMRGRWRRWTLAVVWGVAARGDVRDRERPPLLTRPRDQSLPRDGVGRRSFVISRSRGSRPIVPCCRSLAGACPTASALCSTCCTGPPSTRASSGPTSCFTCSCWPAVWRTTCLFSRSPSRTRGNRRVAGCPAPDRIPAPCIRSSPTRPSLRTSSRTFLPSWFASRRRERAGSGSGSMRPGMIRERLSRNALRPSDTHCSTFIGFMGMVSGVRPNFASTGVSVGAAGRTVTCTPSGFSSTWSDSAKLWT